MVCFQLSSSITKKKKIIIINNLLRNFNKKLCWLSKDSHHHHHLEELLILRKQLFYLIAIMLQIYINWKHGLIRKERERECTLQNNVEIKVVKEEEEVQNCGSFIQVNNEWNLQPTNQPTNRRRRYQNV